jgi:glycerol uptake facilitator-like aquaporin
LVCPVVYVQISGAIIAPVSILFMVYALYLYHKRTNQLLTRSTLRYDDARGPWLLTMLLILVTIVVIVLALEAFKVSLRT